MKLNKGLKNYHEFIKKEKLRGLTHKEALLKWKNKKEKLEYKGGRINKSINRLTKQIIVPRGKSAIINIYMTQNNKPSHEIEEKKDVIYHHVNIPQVQQPKQIENIEEYKPINIPSSRIPIAPPLNIPNAPPLNIPNAPPLSDSIPWKKKTPEEIEAEKEDRKQKELKRKDEAQKSSLMDEIRKAMEARNIRKVIKPEDEFEGEGMGDWLSNLKNVVLDPYKALLKMPKHVKDRLQQYGNEQIKNIYVCRKPLNTRHKILLNIITLGGFKKASQDYGYYDDVFHLYMVFRLQSGKLLLIERNQRVFIKDATEEKIKIKDVITININKKLTLNEMFDNAMEEDKKLFHYDPITHNCQNFTTVFLKSSNLLNSNINKFVNQDVEQLLTGYSRKVASKVIDFASLAHNVYQGGIL